MRNCVLERFIEATLGQKREIKYHFQVRIWSGLVRVRFWKCGKFQKFSLLAKNCFKNRPKSAIFLLIQTKVGQSRAWYGSFYIPMSMTNVFYPKIMWRSVAFYYFSQFLYFLDLVHESLMETRPNSDLKMVFLDRPECLLMVQSQKSDWFWCPIFRFLG